MYRAEQIHYTQIVHSSVQSQTNISEETPKTSSRNLSMWNTEQLSTSNGSEPNLAEFPGS